MQQRDVSQKTKKRRRLSVSLTLLILLCWVLPLLLMVGISGYSASASTRAHVVELVSLSVENTMDNLRKELDSAVNDSLNVSYSGEIRTAYTRFQRNQNRYEMISTAEKHLSNQFQRNGRLRAAYLLVPGVTDETDYPCYTLNPAHAVYSDARAFYESPAAGRALELIPTLDSGIAFFEDSGRLYMVRVLSLAGNQLRPYGALVLELNLAQLLENIRALPWATHAALRVGEAELQAGAQAHPVDFAALPPQGMQLDFPASQDVLRLQGGMPQQRYTLQYSVLADIGPWLREGSTPRLLLVLALLSVPLMVLVFVFLSRQVTGPIRLLGELSHRIEEGEFGRQVETGTLRSTEFYELGANLNAMSARLEYQFERLYREELALRDARIKALQSQINPHFLGNTLEIINWEARMAGNVKVSRMMEALSTMLEAALDRSKRPLVHLSEEMMYVNSYLYIIGERLGKRLEVVQEIDPALLDWYVPRLILQPIVENAIEHGVYAHTRGLLVIRAYRLQDDWMALEVENNSPMSPEDEERVRVLLDTETEPEGAHSANIGIRNVHQRLRILYGEKSGLSVKNTKSSRTVSSMCIQHPRNEQIASR